MSVTFSEGDLVEAVKTEIASSTRLRGVLKSRETFGLVMQAQGYEPALNWLDAQGFTLILLEKAIPIPTEPGIYVSWVNPPSPTIVHCIGSGEWVDLPDSEYLTVDDVAALMPLTRLEPVVITARRVLARMDAEWALNSYSVAHRTVSKEFGVGA
jgi:hypothetical protein